MQLIPVRGQTYINTYTSDVYIRCTVCGCFKHFLKSFCESVHSVKCLAAVNGFVNVTITTRGMEVDQQNTPAAIRHPVTQKFSEGKAEIVSGGKVFYNPVQEFNRDLSIAVLNVYYQHILKERSEKTKKQKHKHNDTDCVETENSEYKPGEKYENGLSILEALAATGLRSIRYAKEIAGVREIVANDLSKQAVESIEENVRHNGVEHLVRPSHNDAMQLMYLSAAPTKHFDVVDLDPYGCPNRFLDGAIQCISDGGLLLITATDMAVLAGNAPEACFVKYGSVPLRMKACHEMALRILLHCVDQHANRYGKYIVPLLSISADFYIRIFLRVHCSQAECKFSMSKRAMIHQCTGCDIHTLQPLGILKPNPTEKNPKQVKFCIPTGPAVNTNCTHCGHRHHLGGPIWSAPIHNKEFVADLLDAVQSDPLWDLGTQKRLVGVLTVVLEELIDIPLYYALDKMCSVLKLEAMPLLKFRSALLHAGYRVSYSHASKNSIKTDAPATVLWDILRCWHKLHPVRAERMLEGTPIKAILEQPPEKADYELEKLHPAANPKSRKEALSRYQTNPTPHWGPGMRATIMIGENPSAKRIRNQNKKQKHRLSKNSAAQLDKEIQNVNQAESTTEDEGVANSKQAKLTEEI